MLNLFFTSNTNHYHKINDEKIPNEIDNTNGIVDQLKQLIDDGSTILYVASNPLDIKTTDSYDTLFFEGLKL